HSAPPTRGRTRAITDHSEILRWAKERHVRPARVKEPDGDHVLIDLDIPAVQLEEALEPISRDEWFAIFDENGLALLVEDMTEGGHRSNFNKLVQRRREE